jgi:alanine racemase
MTPSLHVTVQVDLAQIRRNTEAIIARTGVEVIAVVKADAYGMGADAVAAAIGDLVDGFYVFDANEVIAAKLRDVANKRTLCLLGSSNDPKDYLAHDIRPIVWTKERATALRSAKPVVSLDTGQQRFGCSADELAGILDAADSDEIMTHAVTMDQVRLFCKIIETRLPAAAGEHFYLHATGSAMLNESQACLDAVRPGLALYRSAARVSAHLVEVKDSNGLAGYTGFKVPRFGVILAGYLQGLRTGPCIVNGVRRNVLEVGMQSAFVEVGKNDHTGDVVVLLGDGLEEETVADAWDVRSQEVLIRLTSAGRRIYRS